jgi:hypothetical protein
MRTPKSDGEWIAWARRVVTKPRPVRRPVRRPINLVKYVPRMLKAWRKEIERDSSHVNKQGLTPFWVTAAHPAGGTSFLIEQSGKVDGLVGRTKRQSINYMIPTGRTNKKHRGRRCLPVRNHPAREPAG